MVASPNVLDSDHLRRQTNGDGDLERELLALFEAQCGKLVPFILAPGRPAERAEASHALRGGALAIGAEQLAGVTRHLEEAFLLQPEDAVLRPLLSELRDAATELAREVARWRDRAGAGRTGSRQG